MFATETEHISTDLVALPDTGKEDKRGGMVPLVVHNNITACISLDCLPQGDDAEAEEEEDIYVVVHNRTQQNRIRIASLNREMTQKQSRTPDYLHRFTRLQ